MKKKITEILNTCGIEEVSFCAFSLVEDRLLGCRAKARLPKTAKTIIMCAFPYAVQSEKPYLLSRYAAVPDYHEVCKKYLQKAAEELSKNFTENSFIPFQDNSPIPEVYAAACAGLGVRGENGLLITEKYGSWVFLGEIVTDLEVECENHFKTCIKCGKCKEKCPKADGCLSSLCQKKGILTPEEAEQLKQNGILWGCDICAEVCPMNAGVKIEPLEEFLCGYRNTFSPNEDFSCRAYTWRGEAVILRNFNIHNNE